MTSDPLERTWLPCCVCVSDKTSSDPTVTLLGSNEPTFPFTLPTGGAVPLWVSQSYPEKLKLLGPTTEGVLLDVPVLEVPLPVLLEVPLPDVPVLEVPLPVLLEVPLPVLLEVPLPDVPVLDVPLPLLLEVPLPDVPLLDGPLVDDPL
jgi:hypothetical protein